jgi:pimeloyl-ACP methyl ester carboxylesterase
VRLDRHVYPPAVNPADALGTVVEEVQHTSPVGRGITAAACYDLDRDGVNHLDDTSWVTVPPLVFQTTDDETAPIVAAGQRRGSRPQLVTLVKVNGAGHVEAWNTDPQGYQRLTDSLSSS